MMKIELPKWYDLHAHFRQDDVLAPLVRDHIAMGCAGILAMPNTSPPVAKVFERDELSYWSIEYYHRLLSEAADGDLSEIIVPLYLTKHTTPEMIEIGAKKGVLKACKYYPPHGTTGAEFGCPLSELMSNGVIKALEDNGVILCMHGEEHEMPPERYFARDQNAEEVFYRERAPKLIEKFPNLKIVAEHVTTKVAVDFVRAAPAHVGATVTPQHLLYTVGHLLKGLQYHLYCLPLLKFDEDRQALRDAVTNPGNTKFFAGTDSAPHTKKMTDCGCAAGCYTGGIAPQLYAQGFEEAGMDLGGDAGQAAFKNFLCFNGPQFYALNIPDETFTLEKSPQEVQELVIEKSGQRIKPLPLGLSEDDPVFLNWSIVG